ncbi:MAG: hypothetical protein ACKVP5_21175 [Aestuariivirga sp.]
MTRRTQIPSITAILGVTVGISVGLARSEKIWAESLQGYPAGEISIMLSHQGHEPFDPRRVPQSGGMASRLLAGITVKPV